MIIINKKIINFKWAGWHPNCRCYTIPIVKGEARYWEDEDKRGNDNEIITELPDNSEAKTTTVNGDYVGYSRSLQFNRQSVGLNISYRFGSLNAQVKKTTKAIANDDLIGRKK